MTLPGGGSHISPCSWPCMRPASPDRDKFTAEVVGSHTKRTGVTDVTAAAGRRRPRPRGGRRSVTMAGPRRDSGVIFQRFLPEPRSHDEQPAVPAAARHGHSGIRGASRRHTPPWPGTRDEGSKPGTSWLTLRTDRKIAERAAAVPPTTPHSSRSPPPCSSEKTTAARSGIGADLAEFAADVTLTAGLRRDVARTGFAAPDGIRGATPPL